jgi:hypothetical protein
MSNRQLEFILTMKDEATRVWNNVESRISAGAKRLGESFLSLQGIFAAVAGFQGLKKVMGAANEATTSVDRLSSALKAAGVYSQELVDQMTAYSTARMNATTFDDEAVTTLQALLVTMTGMTGTAVEPLVDAALDLATALGIDAVEAGKMIAQSANGRNVLAKYGIELDKNASQQENLGRIVEQLTKKMNNFAENAAKTTTGRIKQMANQVAETEEAVGKMVNKIVAELSPAILVVIRVIGGAVQVAIGTVQTFFSAAFAFFFELAAVVEMGLNKLGISNSHTMQQFAAVAEKQTKEYGQKTLSALTEIFSKTEAGAKKAGSAIGKIVGDGDDAKMNEYARRIANLKEDLEKLTPATAEWVKVKKELNTAEAVYANLIEQGTMLATGDVKISLWSKLFWGGQAAEAMAATTSAMESFFAGMKGPGTKLGVIKDYSEDTGSMYDAYKTVTDQISTMRRQNAKDDADFEIETVRDWLDKVKEMSLTMYVDVAAAQKVADDRIEEIKARSFEKSFKAYAQQAQRGISLVADFTKQKYDAELDAIETAKENDIGRIDAALQNEKLSVAQRKKLEQEKAATVKKYDDEARAVKKKQWQADKEARLFMAIIDTASAVVEALPNVALAIIAGAMGAAQVAIIAGQSAPKFKSGTGAGGFTVPEGFNNDNFPVLVSSGERVNVTPRGGGGGGGSTLVFNFNAPVSDEEFVYQSIVKRLRATGMSIDRTFRDSNTMVLGHR